MTILPQDLDYTGLDQIAIEARLLRLIDALFPEWTDRQRASLGNILIRLLASVGDRTQFYQDNQARESRWTTARLRKSLLSFSKMLGYKPKTAGAATADEVFTLPAMAGTVLLPAGTRILTAEVTAAIAYQLLTDLLIPANTTTITASVENSVTQTEVFTSTDLANQVFNLRSAPYLDGTLSLTAGDGVYGEVDDLLDSTPTSRDFTVSVDDRDRPVVRLGDGINGRIPKGTCTFIYRTGGGVAGRVEQNRLTRLEGSFSDSLGNPARITATNPQPSSGGDDRETNAQIKVNGPRNLRTLKTLVGREDYEIAAEAVPGVARALHLPDSLGPNQGHVLVVPDDLTTATTGLLSAVTGQWAPGGPFKKLNTYQVDAIAAPYLVVNVSSIVYLAARTTRAQGRATIVAALTDFFALNTIDPTTGELVQNARVNFGYYFQQQNGGAPQLPWSDIFNAIRDSDGVRLVDPGPGGLTLNNVRDNISLEAQQFPKLGSVALIDGSTGDAF